MSELHPIMAQALAPFAPPSSSVHQAALSDDERIAIDYAILSDKLAGGYQARSESAAFDHQIKTQDKVGAA